ncbi:hypothetical protein VNO80_29793 [Phaseolus coccineus]|uniref:Uncharacterized protein n=1 Tax=Phaseolus coccineus TaxID=3886 RepID=A0AAN9QIU9_PHACN
MRAKPCDCDALSFIREALDFHPPPSQKTTATRAKPARTLKSTSTGGDKGTVVGGVEKAGRIKGGEKWAPETYMADKNRSNKKIERKKVRNYREFALFPVRNDEGNEDNVMVFYVKNLN